MNLSIVDSKGTVEDVHVELSKKELDRVIMQLSRANEVVQQLKT